jgi:DNA ligase (NAD+)
MISKIQLYHNAKESYYAGDPIMCDDAFDHLERELIKTNPEILLQVGAEVRGGKVQLPIMMGSLNQVHNQRELDNWNRKFLGDRVLMEKLDGNSVLVSYKDGKFYESFSRGNGLLGANNSRHTVRMRSIPKFIGINCLVRGELIIKKCDWLTVKSIAESKTGKTFANSRNFIAGFLNGSIGIAEIYPYIDFVAFEIIDYVGSKSSMIDTLASFNFKTPKYIIAQNTAEYLPLQSLLKIMINDSPYELDGVVVEANIENRPTVDADDLNPTYAIKIKPPSTSETTTVKSVEWNCSKGGLLKPVVWFEPVQIGGVTISKASGYNAKNIFDNGIGPGAIVTVTRQGDVIPCVSSVIAPVEPDPVPHSTWDANGVELIQMSGFERQRELKKLDYFFNKLEVEFIGPKNAEKLYDAGVKNAVDVFNSSEQFFVQILGVNGKKAWNIFQEKISSVDPARLFASLDSFGRGIGERKLRALIDGVGIEKFLNGSFVKDDILALRGFDTTSAEVIIENYKHAISQYTLIQEFVSFNQTAERIVHSGHMSGEIICATGFRFKPDQLEMIISAGGVVEDGVTSKTTILVTKDPSSSSSKIKKARERGIKIITPDEFLSSFKLC